MSRGEETPSTGGEAGGAPHSTARLEEGDGLWEKLPQKGRRDAYVDKKARPWPFFNHFLFQHVKDS